MNLLSRYAALGLLAGMTVACSAGTTSKAATSGNSANMINREMIENSERHNAFDLIRALRPNWLTRRGVQTLTQQHGDVTVYYGGSRLGGPETLRTVGANDIEYIEFLSGPSATQRYGTNHGFGVIQITPRGTTGGRTN